MKVFLSWSGERSRLVATLLDEWLRCVLQAIRPWISTKDIDRGSLWFSEIQDQLQDVTTGIICLTQENKEKPWILFEAGALAKGLSNSRVCTLLIDLEPHDIRDPLAQFNHTKPDQGGIYALVHTLNNRLGDNRLDPAILTKVLDTYWAQFEERFQKIIVDTPVTEKPKARPEKDILTEILEHTRSLNSRLVDLEKNQLNHEKSFYEWRLLNQKIPIKELQHNNYIDRLRELAEEGLSDVEIGQKLNVPTAEVVTLLRKHGIPRKFRL
ncbi:toll/interleukin-1 receptor domain-containing protein [Aeromonas veronii]|uniref:toll/interleukin-1 receptor domain-containing protein n=1 Tax=Aeromonas veronii TaxID=654 RepID=UPI003BF5CFB2